MPRLMLPDSHALQEKTLYSNTVSILKQDESDMVMAALVTAGAAAASRA
jgi:hypothetical protein